MTEQKDWNKDQEFERSWWGNCANTFGEEVKQQVYAKKIGLIAGWDYGHFPVYDMKGLSVIDIGGGPVSMLLKCKNVDGWVVDPCNYPDWVVSRYEENGICFIREAAEDHVPESVFVPYDEAWCYNCLQHTQDPEKIIKNMRSYAKVVRIFEWIEEPVSIGHPHTLHEKDLNNCLGGFGKTEQLNESGCLGLRYSGIFKGDA